MHQPPPFASRYAAARVLLLLAQELSLSLFRQEMFCSGPPGCRQLNPEPPPPFTKLTSFQKQTARCGHSLYAANEGTATPSVAPRVMATAAATRFMILCLSVGVDLLAMW